jgi:hypothetical protein
MMKGVRLEQDKETKIQGERGDSNYTDRSRQWEEYRLNVPICAGDRTCIYQSRTVTGGKK